MHPAVGTSFDAPRYSIAEGARFLGVPSGTFGKWVSGYHFPDKARRGAVSRGDPVVQTPWVEDPRGPRLAFASLVEGMVISALREAGFSLQALRRTVGVLRDDIGSDWALASHRLRVSGADILWNFAEKHHDEEILEAIDRRQRVFAPVVQSYLDRIVYEGEYAGQLYLPIMEEKALLIDPSRHSGQPMIADGLAPLEPMMRRVRAGEPPAAVAEDYGVQQDVFARVLAAAGDVAA